MALSLSAHNVGHALMTCLVGVIMTALGPITIILSSMGSVVSLMLVVGVVLTLVLSVGWYALAARGSKFFIFPQLCRR